MKNAAKVCKDWQAKGFDTIAVVCRSREKAAAAARELGKYIPIVESDLEKAEFSSGIMVLPVEYTKGLEFDAVLILIPPERNILWMTDMQSFCMWRRPVRSMSCACCTRGN